MSEQTQPAVEGPVLSDRLGRALIEMREPVVHILSDDLELMELSETTAIAASVAFSTPDRGRSEPLIRLSTANAILHAVARKAGATSLTALLGCTYKEALAICAEAGMYQGTVHSARPNVGANSTTEAQDDA